MDVSTNETGLCFRTLAYLIVLLVGCAVVFLFVIISMINPTIVVW